MLRTASLLIVYFLGILSALSQTLRYDVVRGGSIMGTTKVSRISTGSETLYHLNTQTEFRILLSFEVEYDLKETFENGVLQHGTSFNTLNGSTQKETTIRKENAGYRLTINGIPSTVSESAITESVSEIYFEEPYDNKKVYSAYFARYLYFDQTGEHEYSLTSPDGTNIYVYENGICVEVKISRDFASFSQVLQPEVLAEVRSKKIKPNATQ